MWRHRRFSKNSTSMVGSRNCQHPEVYLYPVRINPLHSNKHSNRCQQNVDRLNSPTDFSDRNTGDTNILWTTSDSACIGSFANIQKHYHPRGFENTDSLETPIDNYRQVRQLPMLFFIAFLNLFVYFSLTFFYQPPILESVDIRFQKVVMFLFDLLLWNIHLLIALGEH